MSNSVEQLRWLNHMGVDETLSEEPIDRTKVTPPPLPKNNASNSIQNTSSTSENTAAPVQNIAGMSEAPVRAPVAPIPEMSSMKQLEDAAQALADKASTLDELRAAIDGFDGLAIKRTAMNTVFSDGNPDADIMFIGEAPGANEDEQGIPFCGASGQLMDKACGHIGLTREKNWYITNTVFWRPPGNRKPTKDENAICKPFVEKHIALQKPKLVVLVGGTATSTLMDSTKGITKLHGTFTEYSNPYLDSPIHMSAVYHPSFLLRSPSKKKDFWFDLLKIRHFCQENGVNL